jgi:hypothetical protein
MEIELRMWWQLQRDAKTLYAADPNAPELRHYYEEAEAMMLNTDWLALRASIAAVLTYCVAKHPEWLELCASLA